MPCSAAGTPHSWRWYAHTRKYSVADVRKLLLLKKAEKGVFTPVQNESIRAPVWHAGAWPPPSTRHAAVCSPLRRAASFLPGVGPPSRFLFPCAATCPMRATRAILLSTLRLPSSSSPSLLTAPATEEPHRSLFLYCSSSSSVRTYAVGRINAYAIVHASRIKYIVCVGSSFSFFSALFLVVFVVSSSSSISAILNIKRRLHTYALYFIKLARSTNKSIYLASHLSLNSDNVSLRALL